MKKNTRDASMITRVFFDASALFAAAYSETGASRELIRLAIQGRVQVVVSNDVLTETERNIGRKAPAQMPLYKYILQVVDPEITPDPDREDVWAVEGYVAQKDAPIIAAAIKAGPDYLITFDRKDLIDPPDIAARSGLRIVLPQVALRAVREQLRG